MDNFDAYHVLLGLPKGLRPVTPIQLLGLTPGERDPEVIRRAADRRMTHLKSQQGGRRVKEVQQLLNEVAVAKTSLLDPHRPPDLQEPPGPPIVPSESDSATAPAVVPPLASPPIDETAQGSSAATDASGDSSADGADSDTFVPRPSRQAVAAYHRKRSTPAAPVAAIVALLLAVLLSAIALYALLN